MSDVILFAPRLRAVVRAPEAAPREAAQILFFTGVRYERQPEVKPAEAPTPRRRRPAAGRVKTAGQPA